MNVSGVELDTTVLEVADYMINNRCTLREVASVFDIGKSTAHVYVTTRLQSIDNNKYLKVMELLQYNKSVRSSRGGLAASRNRSEECR